MQSSKKILPEYMNDAGYESHMVGKWHLGSHEQATLPSQRGFKTYLGYLGGTDYYYSHKVRNGCTWCCRLLNPGSSIFCSLLYISFLFYCRGPQHRPKASSS